MKKQILRFRKFVKEAAQGGSMVAHMDPQGRPVTTNCWGCIDELDEFNEWRINGASEIIAPAKLKGYGLIQHSGHLLESKGVGMLYSGTEANKFIKSLRAV